MRGRLRHWAILSLPLAILVGAAPVAAQMEVSGAISQDTSWPAALYHVTGNLTIQPGVTLTIDAGATIKFDRCALIVQGTLDAFGSDASPIRFTGLADDNIMGDSAGDGPTIPNPSSWDGIEFQPGSAGTLRHCELWFGGAGDGLVRVDGASPLLEDCELNAGYFGVACRNGAAPDLVRVKANACASVPVGMTLDSHPILDQLILGSDQDNAYEGIGILTTAVTDTDTLRAYSAMVGAEVTDSVPYVLLSTITVQVGGSLTVDPGVVVKSGGGARITVEGRLDAKGTADDMVVFTSIRDDGVGNPRDTNRDGTASSPRHGDWGGIRFERLASGSLRHCDIAFAGPGALVSIATRDSSISVLDSDLHHGFLGIELGGWGGGRIERNVIRQVEGAPLTVLPGLRPTVSGNSAFANGIRGVGLIPATVDTTVTLEPLAFAGVSTPTYWVKGIVTVAPGNTLTVQPGQVFAFEDGGSGFDVHGQMNAIGTEDEPIYFTSVHDDCAGEGQDVHGDGWTTGPCLGDWRSVEVQSDFPSTFEYCTFRFGGNGCNGVLEFGMVSPNVRNCTFEFNTIGIAAHGPDIPLANTVSKDIGRDFIGNVTRFNAVPSVTYLHGTLARDWTLRAPVYGGYYILDGALVIPYDVTLTIDTGVDLAFEPTAMIDVRGALITYGDNLITNPSDGDLATRHPGHDPNGNGGDDDPNPPGASCYIQFGCDILQALQDGSQCVRQPNSHLKAAGSDTWQGIVFRGQSSDLRSHLRNGWVRYGEENIRIVNASPLFENMHIENSVKAGVRVLGNSRPRFQSCVIEGCGTVPMALSVAADVESIGNQFVDNGFQALELVGERLTGDFVLGSPTLARLRNWPWVVLQDFGVGPEARLTIEPGVVLKFAPDVRFLVEGDFEAQGTVERGQEVVLTSLADDTYGGDTNQDGRTEPDSEDAWGGVTLVSGANATTSRLENVVLAHVGHSQPEPDDTAALRVEGANVLQVHRSRFLNNSIGIRAGDLSIVNVDSSDFYGNAAWAVQNFSFGGVFDAENCWWGGVGGPLDLSDDVADGGWFNPEGDGDRVSDRVDYDPWVGEGALWPVLGDVTRNGTVSSLDASYILRDLVGSLTLDPIASSAADVTCSGDVTTVDASDILLWLAGARAFFECDEDSVMTRALPDGSGSLVIAVGRSDDEGNSYAEIGVDGPVRGIHLTLMGSGVQWGQVVWASEEPGGVLAQRARGDRMEIAVASARALDPDARLHVPWRGDIDVDPGAAVGVDRALGDGRPMHVRWETAPDEGTYAALKLGIDRLVPNPFNPSTSIHLRVPASGADLPTRVTIHDISGRLVATLHDAPLAAGEHVLRWNGTDRLGRPVGSGVYLCHVVRGDEKLTRKMTLLK